PGLIRYQFRWTPVLEVKSAAMQRVLLLLGPRILTMACIQAYYVARDNLASRFDTVGVGALNLGWTIEQVPETILGTAIAVAILPSLAEFINRGQVSEFTGTVNRALRVMLGLSLPVAAVLAVIVRPLSEVVFNYDAARLDLLTVCTWAFLIGLVGDTWLEVAVRSFYANQNTRTPLIAAFLQAASFVLLSLALTPLLGLAGIPLSAALTFTVQAVALLLILDRRFHGLLRMGSTPWRAAASALVSGGAALGLLVALPLGPLPAGLLALIAGGAAGLPLVWPEARLLFRL
ncbi:MAG: lipid II flippase MurJ, partial [Bacteroidota bacterium]